MASRRRAPIDAPICRAKPGLLAVKLYRRPAEMVELQLEGGDWGMTQFGCKKCWPDDAQEAWEARSQLAQHEAIVDDSHFIVRILACEGCGQEFLSTFTETIDWNDGDDPQYWSLIPVTPAEATRLVAAGEEGLRQALGALDRERRALQRDAPKGSMRTSYWSSGISIGPHD
jgi:hypothetical protein